MEERYRKDIYQIGTKWAQTRLQELGQFSADYERFKEWMLKVMEMEDFILETTSVPVRIYNQYKRYPKEARSAFMAGVWDALHGNMDDSLPVVTL